jgi:hypothetical protein
VHYTHANAMCAEAIELYAFCSDLRGVWSCLAAVVMLTLFVFPALAQEQSRFSGAYKGTWHTLTVGPGNEDVLIMALEVDDVGAARGSIDFTGYSGVAHYELSGHITDSGEAKFTASYQGGKQTVTMTGQFAASSRSIDGNYTVESSSFTHSGMWKASRQSSLSPAATPAVPPASAQPR